MTMRVLLILLLTASFSATWAQDQVERPIAKPPKAEQPIADQPKADQPKAEQPIADRPKAEQPKVDKPIADQPKIENPIAGTPKAKGKPNDPGADGRLNAAQKKAANPGKGSGKTKDMEVTPLTEKADGKKGKGKKDA